MALLEDPRKRAAEARKVRIDHSDVYLENEKLAEALDSNLDLLSRRRHRQVIHRDHEIKLLRKTLSNMNVTKTSATPAATSLHTSSAAPPPSLRRLKPPPTFVKLDVHVPHQGSNSKDSDNSDDDDFDDSSDDEEETKKWRKLRSRKTRMAWGEKRDKDSSSTANHRAGSAKHEIKRITRVQIRLNNLDMDSIPQSWYTEVHQPSEVVPLRRRASSAHPSTRPTLPASSSPSSSSTSSTSIRRPKSETSKLRPRRVKSAFPITSISTTSVLDDDDRNESALFCGGPQQQKKTEMTRSRRQLMEQMGVRRYQAETSEAVDSNRLKFLMALRRERERLDGRVKMFLQSCDKVGEGGISSRKAKDYQTFLLPQMLT